MGGSQQIATRRDTQRALNVHAVGDGADLDALAEAELLVLHVHQLAAQNLFEGGWAGERGEVQCCSTAARSVCFCGRAANLALVVQQPRPAHNLVRRHPAQLGLCLILAGWRRGEGGGGKRERDRRGR